MTEDLVRSLRSGGPVSPAIQMRKLLVFGREHGWEFELAWRWSYERVKFPHDTTHRREWKQVLGERHDDARAIPTLQRDAWHSAYDRLPQTPRERSVGLLIAA